MSKEEREEYYKKKESMKGTREIEWLKKNALVLTKKQLINTKKFKYIFLNF